MLSHAESSLLSFTSNPGMILIFIKHRNGYLTIQARKDNSNFIFTTGSFDVYKISLYIKPEPGQPIKIRREDSLCNCIYLSLKKICLY